MPDDQRRIPAFCPLCVSGCGCEAVVENGRLVALEPDPSHPTGKSLCAKGRAAPEQVEARDRLLFPLRRTRPKGEPDPGWRPISWAEALDETASTLRRIAAEDGPEAGGNGDFRRVDVDLSDDQQLRLAEDLQRSGAMCLAPGVRLVQVLFEPIRSAASGPIRSPSWVYPGIDRSGHQGQTAQALC